MKILLVTPLYPPDIADPAPYVKELATRFSKAHDVTILMYNHLPEPVAGVTLLTIQKNQPLPLRLLKLFFVLVRQCWKHDVVYVQNGPSTELPAALASFFTRTPYHLCLGDESALHLARERRLLRLVQRLAIRRARFTVVHTSETSAIAERIARANSTVHIPRPLPRPEILPFHDYPANALTKYELSWEEHLTALLKVLSHAKV